MRKSFNKMLFVLFVLLILPSFSDAATYWQITASTSPASLKSNLTAARPANFSNYTTPGGATKTLTNVTRTPYPSVSYIVSVPVGYKLMNVKVDGLVKGTTAGTYTVEKGTTLSHTIVASYAAASYVITTYTATGGNISASLTAPAGSTQNVTVTPYSGYQLIGAIIDNSTYALADDLPAFVIKTGGASGANYAFTAVNAAHSIKGIFALIPTVTAIISTPNQTVASGTTGIVLDGSASSSNVTGTIYNWAATCGTVTPTGPNAKTATYAAPATIGSCTVTLTVNATGVTTSPQATVTFTTVSSVVETTNICLACHDGTNGPVVSGFTTSPHYGVKSCADCHNPGNTLSHAYTPLADMVNICKNCHTDAQGNAPDHPVSIELRTCVSCHNPHSTVASVAGMQLAHYNNITSGMYPASYITSKSACTNCHVVNPSNAVIRQQWAQSGHANINGLAWINYDFKTMTGCVQCHTTTGFTAYSTGKVTTAWGSAGDKTKELLTCVGCHSNVAAGIVRTVAPVKPFADDTYLNRNIGPSNICMNCHSGRNNGKSVAKLAVLNNVTGSFITPHYFAAGGTLEAKSGYHFPGESYAQYTTNSHRWIGMDSSSGTGNGGPCVACHKNSASGHTFRSGAINLCVNCHGTSGFNTFLADDKASYTNALSVLKAQLAAKGFVYSPDYPYFGSATNHLNWGDGPTGTGNMGAAFNYVLLLNEPGAFVHNSGYAKKLIFDSIDYLYNGSITGSITPALDSLTAANAISPTEASNVATYKANSGCRVCHSSLSGAHAVHVGNLSDNFSAYGDDANNSIPSDYRFGCGNCHPLNSALHRNGVVDIELYNPGATGFKKNNLLATTWTGTGNDTVCLNVYCHSSGQEESVRTYTATPQWGGTFPGNHCAGCHGDPPNYPSGGIESPAANSHYSQNWNYDSGYYAQSVEGGHLVGLHFDNIKKDPADSWQPLFPNSGSAGSGAGHGDPATSTTISCPTCHAATVNVPSFQSAPGTIFSCSNCHGQQPGAVIADKSRHVNGTRDISFMTGTFRSRAQIRLENFTSVIRPLGWTRNNGYKTYNSFDSVPFSGSYNPADKSCVTACHFNQSAKWGDTTLNCISCHADL